MTPERLKQLAADPRFVPGIYNYCDRWCERCAFTRRCLNFAMSEENQAPEDQDQSNEHFWDTLSDNLKLAIDMVKEDCEKRGIDFNEIEREARQRIASQTPASQAQRNEHPLVAGALAYLKQVDGWLKAHYGVLRERGVVLESAADMDLGGTGQVEAQVRDLHDALEVVRWYYMFISAKLYRAVRQEEFDEGPATVVDPVTRHAVKESCESDSLGSAKIALVAMDRSLAAWARLRDHFPEQGDEIIDILVALDRLRKAVDLEFPRARSFVRPGLDDGTSPEPPQE